MTSTGALVRQAIDRAYAAWTGGDVDGALASCREALRLDPLHVDALSHTGTILWARGDRSGAQSFYDRAHRLAPRHPGVLLNLATLRGEDGDLEAARVWIDRAAAAAPDHPEIVWRRGLIDLANGDYASGWAGYEAGLLQPGLRGRGPGFDTPPWDGTPCDRLLVWHEQGFGDTIQFVRYAELCRDRVSRLVVLCPPELVALLKSCPFVDDAVDTIAAGAFDRHVSVMSLPHLFGTALDTVPANIPYLAADAARRARFPVRAMSGGRPCVGLVWAGNFRRDQPRFHPLDRSRNLSFDDFAPLLSVDGIAFCSLQNGDAASEARDGPLIDWMGEVDDFADTAAIVDQLDLVISVDTSVVHLAGALGKPVWILSRVDACWRWLRNRPDSPWYPTARVFGQRRRGDWRPVIDEVRVALSAWRAAR